MLVSTNKEANLFRPKRLSSAGVTAAAASSAPSLMDCDDMDCYETQGGSGRRRSCCCIGSFVAFILLFAMSWDTLEPTEFGLVKNGFTGYVDLRPSMVYEGGRYFIWLRHYFLPFPRNLRNLDFDWGGMRPPIPARTGPDPDDRESGGQPVTFSVSFQYRLQKSTVPLVYQTYGLAWEASYMRFAQQAITNVAQQFTPKQFWNERVEIQHAMLRAVNRSIFHQGYAIVTNLQLLKVSKGRHGLLFSFTNVEPPSPSSSSSGI